MNPVKITYEKDDIYEKSDSEKLNILLDIAFSNHEQLVNQGLTLYGNGDPAKGLCSQLATQRTRLNWLLAILSVVGTAGLAIITTLLVK